MRNYIYPTLFMLASLGSFAQDRTSTSLGIHFSSASWPEAVSLAQKENKLIFLDAYASWCGPCKWMDKNVFPTAEAGKFFNENFINIKLDMQKGEGIELAKKYDVHAFPTYLFINHEGDVVHKIIGSRGVKEFLVASEKATSIHTWYATQAWKFDSGKYTPDDVRAMADTFDEAGDEKRYFVLMVKYPDVFRKLKGDSLYNRQMADFRYRDAVSSYLAAKDYDAYARAVIKHQNAYPTSDWNDLNSLAWSFYEKVDNKEYLKVAINWALESVRLKSQYANLDTVANLYHKIGNKERARDYAIKAIAAGREAGEDTSSTEKMLLSL